MEMELMNDIQRGLIEKQKNLNQWCESCSPDEMETHLGPDGGPKLHAHLDVIDACIHKLEEGTLGICEICREAVDRELLQMDYTSTVCLGHFSREELRQLENELELSQIVQRSLLPHKTPPIQGLDISAFSRPAQIVGGDYFDFLQFKDGAHGFVIADVSGHGVSAGMLMTSLQTAFHTLVPEYNSPVDILERINRLYIHNIKFTTFVTIFFSRFDLRTRTLTYANAGHNDAFLYRGGRQDDAWLKPTGAAIGLMEAFTVESKDIQLEKEDILLLYTDGVTEAMNPNHEQFGRERLADVIRGHTGLSAASLIQEILQAVNSFAEGIPLEDDITLVVYKAI
jgi:sigma-B regulation protein RsbU (phosphoserine phosphatase)